jgi:hypothetical protein
LRASTVADLARSGITPDAAKAAGMFDVDNASTVNPDFRSEPALIIPYFDPGRRLVTFGPHGKAFCRVRYTEQATPAVGFTKHKQLRYSQPKASGVHAYFAPLVDWQKLLDDTAEPLIITEGEKKSIAAITAGFPVIGLGGVFNFMETAESLLPELDAVKWRGRDVYVCFDSDAALNPNILAAEARLVDELQRKRGARCFLVRLPQDGDAKVGLDDYLLTHGAEGFVALLQGATSLGALDAKVVSLNKSVAWIERENLVYDLEARMFIPKDSFVNGSRFSTLKHITVGGPQRTAPKEISVAMKWLTHPHAQRFSEILFRPGEGSTVTGENGRPALNMWTGWDDTDGDVTPFLELNDYLFQNMRAEDRELPLKLMAYKAQNPAEKIPLALVLIGPQGCGKTLWGECVRDAFAPYSVDVTPASLAGEFQGWLERSLFALINEAKGEDIAKASEQLKALISDLKRPMNEKYRPVRQINTYTTYVITSNQRSVGAFSADDRRMIVTDCPKPREPAFYYDRVRPWKDHGGPKALLGYLLRLDLKGWRPPASAPMSAEKYMAFAESLTPIQRLANDMRTSSEHTVKLWLDQAVAWARMAEVSSNPQLASMAKATLDNVNHFQVRPWYTPEELALIFPSIVSQTLGSRFARSTPAGQISLELRDAGVPYLTCADDPRGFMHKGMLRQYLVVSGFEDWQQPLRQADFDRLMRDWPTYGTITAGRRL